MLRRCQFPTDSVWKHTHTLPITVLAPPTKWSLSAKRVSQRRSLALGTRLRVVVLCDVSKSPRRALTNVCSSRAVGRSPRNTQPHRALRAHIAILLLLLPLVLYVEELALATRAQHAEQGVVGSALLDNRGGDKTRRTPHSSRAPLSLARSLALSAAGVYVYMFIWAPARDISATITHHTQHRDCAFARLSHPRPFLDGLLVAASAAAHLSRDCRQSDTPRATYPYMCAESSTDRHTRAPISDYRISSAHHTTVYSGRFMRMVVLRFNTDCVIAARPFNPCRAARRSVFLRISPQPRQRNEPLHAEQRTISNQRERERI